MEMNILIVEDEEPVAAILREFIETNESYRVTAVANDLASAIDAVEKERPDLVMVDIKLAGASTGFSVAGALNRRKIPCLFSTATPPPFEMPELALGCLSKPYRIKDVMDALAAAEDVLMKAETPSRRDPALRQTTDTSSLSLYTSPATNDREISVK